MLYASSHSRIFVLLLSAVCVTIIVIGASKTTLFSRSNQQVQPHIINRTVSARILGVRQLTNGDVEVTFINQSIKAIYAYTLLTSESPTRQGFTTFATVMPVEAGAIKSERVPLANLHVSTNSRGPQEIVFSALYLEGGNIEGDDSEARKLKATMSGIKEQAEVALQILRSVEGPREKNTTQLLDGIESAATGMKVRDESGPPSHERESGRAYVRDSFLGEIRKMRTNDDSEVAVRRKLEAVIRYYQRLTEKL